MSKYLVELSLWRSLSELNIDDYISFEDLYKERLLKYQEMNEK